MKEFPIKYYFSKRVVLLSGIVLLIFNLSIALLVIAAFYRNALLGLCASLISIILVYEPTYKVVFFVRSIMLGAPALLISDNYLIDNVNGEKYAFSDIENIIERKVNGAKRIVILSEKHYNKKRNLTGLYNNMIKRLNGRYFKGDYFISQMLIKDEEKNLLKNLQAYIKVNNS